MSFPKLEVATPDLETNKSKPYSETLRIVVVIPTSKRPASFEQMLRHLAQNEFPSNLDHIIVVENGPQLGVEKILLRYPHLPLMYLHEPKANKSLALNRALDALDGNPLIVFFDDDVVVHSTCVQAYQDAALQLPERAYLGGPTTAIYEKAPPTWLVNYFFPSEKGLLYEGPLGWTRPNLFFIGFNWACYKDLLIEAGGFDPRFGPGSPSVASGQESQMQRCLQSIHVQGYYVPEATVSHHVTSKTGSPSWILFRLFKSGVAASLLASNATVSLEATRDSAHRFFPKLCSLWKTRNYKEVSFQILRALFFQSGVFYGLIWKISGKLTRCQNKWTPHITPSKVRLPVV